MSLQPDTESNVDNETLGDTDTLNTEPMAQFTGISAVSDHDVRLNDEAGLVQHDALRVGSPSKSHEIPCHTRRGTNDSALSIDSEHHGHGGGGTKFGTFDGVLGRCLLCMWGVIMFLRTGWIVGNAGIWQSTLIMLLSASITLLTTLSLSAICTNGEISHGGPYFLISRSLGPEIGGVIGLLFAVGNTIGVSLHLVGFAEAIASMYAPSTVFFDLDVQLWAAVGLIVLIAIALRGVGPIIRFNLFLLFLMTISIFTFFVGTFIPNESKSAVGFTGYSSKTFGSNWGPQYLPGQDFLSLVAVFFPSVTGCMAGANISGDLKKPSVNIPVGTLWAVAVSMSVYVAIAWVLGATVIRNEVDSVTGELVDGVGLQSEYTIMSQIAAWRPLVDLGILASTFSSATSCFVAAPRILKAVCDDGLFPLLSPLAVGRRRDNEPVRCYWLVAAVCLLVLVVSGGDIVWIAPLVTNFFLVTYGLVNYSVFQWAWSKSPGWRPTFKYHSGSLSLFAAAQSVALMVLIDWAMALATLALAVVAYKYIEWRQLDTNWGTTVESNLYVKGCRIALKYQAMNTEHAKIARPTFLMMLYDHNANDIETLYGFVQHFNFGEGLVVIGHVLIGSLRNEAVRADFLRKKKSFREYALSPQIARKCIMECCIAANYGEGTRTMLQLAGMGGMRPNLFVLRLGDDPDSESNVDSNDNDNDNERDRVPLWFTNLQYAMLSGLGIMAFPKRFELDPIEPVDDNLNVDEVKTVDIWWLFDDGGLTLLMGHLLTKRDRFRNHKLRIMALDESGFEHQSGISSLIEKMRIEAQIKHIVTAQDVDVNENGNEEDNKEMVRYRRIGKSIARHSNDADLCLLTMPYPRDEIKWSEFERILDDLTPKDVPTIFVRGTEHQVLTFFF